MMNSWAGLEILNGHALTLVGLDLLVEEVHAVPLREPLREPVIELGCCHGDRKVALEMERLHPVVETVRQPLPDDSHLTVGVPLDGDREMMEVLADEGPCGIGCASRGQEAFGQLLSGLVRGDDQVTLDRIHGGHLSVRELLLVDDTRVSNNKSRLGQSVLNGEPDGVGGVRELYCHPPAWLQDTVELREALLHQRAVLVDRPRHTARLVDDGFLSSVRPDSVPRLNEVCQVGVVDVGSERRIDEDVVHRCVWQVDPC